MARQRTFFHKCHRCIYRGKAADWQPDPSAQVMLAMDPAEGPVRVGVVEVDLTKNRPKKARKGKQGAPAKSAAAEAQA